MPVHVPFKGNPEVITEPIGGEIQMALVQPGIAMPQVKAGRLKAMGLTSGRSPVVPDVPPLADAGARDFNLDVWTAFVGPAKRSKGCAESPERRGV
ncbi:Tripartite tricarboxylate transporter family receptor [compost metagenome]